MTTTDPVRSRDRWIALAAAVVVAALAATILSTVLDAQRRGRQALEQLQVNQLGQVTRGLDARVTAGFEAINGLARVPYTLKTGDPADSARLEQLQALNPEAQTGMLLIDASETVTNGTLLPPGTVGTRIHRTGLDAAMTAGRATVLPVAPPGVTTAQ